MHDSDDAIAELGNEPPLIADGRSGPPDRREVSARWLTGTFLTGVTSSVLMGVALFAALDGREQLATPPEIADIAQARSGAQDAKAARVSPRRLIARAKDRRRMEVSTVTRVGDRDVIRTLPFVEVSMALAANYTPGRSYPPFDPLDVFAEEGAAQTATTGLIYGAKVESEMTLKTVDFPLDPALFEQSEALSEDEVEKVVRETGSILSDGAVQIAAIHYVDPERFGETSIENGALAGRFGIKVVVENLSVAPRSQDQDVDPVYAEQIIPFTSDRGIADTLGDSGYVGPEAASVADSIATLLGGPALAQGSVLRLGLEVLGDVGRIVRASVYSHGRHVLTLALDDTGRYVPAEEPEPNPEILTAFDDSPPPAVRGNLPTVYDGIYRAAFSYGLSRDMTRQMIRLLASDVDFQSRLGPADRIEVLFSQPGEDDRASPDSELLYVAATFAGSARTLYRFRMGDGAVDYFDRDGRSAKQFLLRNPLPNGVFRSGFGGRRHPILGYIKMHTGVDWAAPRGSPIIAAGNGIVEKAGWAGGYGRQTIIRHANGYESSYNHQSAIARGVVPGAKVRQGQVIGYVGSSGLATGDHLHYEVIVNGTKVDPMRVRLPVGRVLQGADLVAFKQERDRIDELLNDGGDGSLKLASASRLGG